MQHFRSFLCQPMRCLMALTLVWCATRGSAGEPLRVWVDSSGNHAIKARWVDQQKGRAILQREDGARIRIEIARLSARDKKYIRGLADVSRGGPNPLRTSAPSLPVIEPQPKLDLPVAGSVARERSELSWPAASVPNNRPDEAGPLEPDPARGSASVPTTRVVWDARASSQSYSRAIPVRSQGSFDLVMSISSGFGLSGDETPNRLVRIDPDNQRRSVAWESSAAIRLLDHDPEHGRSLLLVGHSPLSDRGELVILSGWNDAELNVVHRRRLPVSSSTGWSSRVRWGRWIDDEHVVMLIDDSLAAWNLVSGKSLFRIRGLNPDARPALSRGRRYVAVPRQGTVEIFRSSDGKPLGRIKTEKDSLPTVSFSPRGNALAIATSHRVDIWDLSAAALRSEITSKRSLGRDRPIWISDDLLMTGNGTLVSVFRGVPIWRYDIAGAIAEPVGNRVAIFRSHPQPELVTVSIPHSAAQRAMQWVDSGRSSIDPKNWELPGRSDWRDGKWVESD